MICEKPNTILRHTGCTRNVKETEKVTLCFYAKLFHVRC